MLRGCSYTPPSPNRTPEGSRRIRCCSRSSRQPGFWVAPDRVRPTWGGRHACPVRVLQYHIVTTYHGGRNGEENARLRLAGNQQAPAARESCQKPRGLSEAAHSRACTTQLHMNRQGVAENFINNEGAALEAPPAHFPPISTRPTRFPAELAFPCFPFI